MLKYNDISFTMKDMNTARQRKDAFLLLREIQKLIEKYRDGETTDLEMVMINLIFPEANGEVTCRFKELFESMLDGELDKISYDLTDENMPKLMSLAGGVLGSFFTKTLNLKEKIQQSSTSSPPV